MRTKIYVVLALDKIEETEVLIINLWNHTFLFYLSFIGIRNVRKSNRRNIR